MDPVLLLKPVILVRSLSQLLSVSAVEALMPVELVSSISACECCSGVAWFEADIVKRWDCVARQFQEVV